MYAIRSYYAIEELRYKLENYEVGKDIPTEKKILIIKKGKLREIINTVAQYHHEFRNNFV